MKNIKIEAESDLINLSDLQNLEKKYGVIFPEDYKKHMQKYNGINPLKRYFFNPGKWYDKFYFEYTLPIKTGDYTFEEANLGGLKDYPEEQLVIGHILGGGISMSFEGKERGSIYAYYSDGEIHKLASSFTEFLNGLEELIEEEDDDDDFDF